jgi:cell wall-associated NlpC family hydrolase
MTTPLSRSAFLVWAAVAVLAAACAGGQPRVRVLPPVLPPAEEAAVPSAPPGLRPTAGESGGLAIARTAETLLGAPYREGGSLPDGFDCSGLVTYVFARLGFAVPRDVRRQAAIGVPVALADIRPGDLLFFATTGSGPTHVAIAIDGSRFIHAPKSGAVVRVESLALSYWARRFLEARRIPPA